MGAEASVKGPGAASSRIYGCAPSGATLSLAPAADAAKYASDPGIETLLEAMAIIVATLLLFLAGPFVLWPLLKTPADEPLPSASPRTSP